MATILVIDDEENVRVTVSRFLERAGHDVITAQDGREALRLLDESAADLVITDLYMPEVDGIEFAMRLSQARPTLPLIAISGGGQVEKGEILELAARLGASETLPKPFTRDELLRAVTQALGGAP